MRTLIILVDVIFTLLTLLVIVYTFMKYFLQPYHKVREIMSRIVEPMLNPVRKLVPPIAGLDFSPFVLIILLQLIEVIIRALIRTLI